MRVQALHLHPVKSTAIRPVPRARVERAGLAGDRRWMVVDRDRVLVSARELHPLLSVVADVPESGSTSALRLSAPGRPSLDVDVPDDPAHPVRLHRHHLLAVPAAESASRWVRETLGRDDLTLVWCDDPTRRPLNPAHSDPGDHTAFADGYPVTLNALASLRRLNDWMAEAAVERGEAPAPLPVHRFRPNVVIDGEDPFAEDAWSHVTIGTVDFRVAKRIDRCVMTTIDPATLQTAPEPIRTLARHRRWDGKTWFGLQLIPQGPGEIGVGDEVSVR